MLLLHYLDFKVLGLPLLFYVQRGKVFEFGLAFEQKSQNCLCTEAQIWALVCATNNMASVLTERLQVSQIRVRIQYVRLRIFSSVGIHFGLPQWLGS